jgi:pimeloyl-ACP methyl ester carboxylesterase
MPPVFHIHEHVIDGAHIREYARAASVDQERPMKLHVKQYTPVDNPNPKDGDVTVIGAHANGFPKELYEPLYEDFYHEAKQRGIGIRAIWIADAAWQGQSAALNASNLGNDPSWLDYARDILHMINSLRLPRPLVGMGHSFGGNAITNVALIHPRLFATLVLLDPVISPWASPKSPEGKNDNIAALSMYRRDAWPSRQAAADGFLKSPFYRSWDPRVFDRWIRYGLRATGAGEQVVLATTKEQEVFTYLRPSWAAYDPNGKTLVRPDLVPDLDPTLNSDFPTHPFYRPEPPATLRRLPHVRPGVLYVFGDRSNVSPPELQAEKLELTGVSVGGSGGAPRGRVKAVSHPEFGHLVPMEAPAFCARAAADWVAAEMPRWRAAEDEFAAWAAAPQAEKAAFSEDYRKYTGKPPRRDKGDKAKAKI